MLSIYEISSLMIDGTRKHIEFIVDHVLIISVITIDFGNLIFSKGSLSEYCFSQFEFRGVRSDVLFVSLNFRNLSRLDSLL